MSLNGPDRPTIRVILSFAVIWLSAPPPYAIRNTQYAIRNMEVSNVETETDVAPALAFL